MHTSPTTNTKLHQTPAISTSNIYNDMNNWLETLRKKDPVDIAETLFKDDALDKLLRTLKTTQNNYPGFFETNLKGKIVELIRKITPQFQSVVQDTSNEQETIGYRVFCKNYLSLSTPGEIAELKKEFREFTNQNPNPPETSKNPFNFEEEKAFYYFCKIKDLAKQIVKPKMEAANSLVLLHCIPMTSSAGG